jgi:hypothetical protein
MHFQGQPFQCNTAHTDADSISRQVMLTVDVAQHKKEQALEILKSLQTFARTMDQCVRFEIFSEVSE